MGDRNRRNSNISSLLKSALGSTGLDPVTVTESKYTCSTCGKWYTSQGDLTVHTSLRHPEPASTEGSPRLAPGPVSLASWPTASISASKKQYVSAVASAVTEANSVLETDLPRALLRVQRSLDGAASDAEAGALSYGTAQQVVEPLLTIARHLRNALSAFDAANPMRDEDPNTQYYIGEQIGEGAYSQVYLTKDYFGKQYVCKVLKNHASTAKMREEWKKEKDFLGSVRHPHIIQLFDSFVFNGKYHYILERATGTLKQYVEQHKNVGVGSREFRFLSAQLLSATHFIHKRGIIHRDLQTDNVLYFKEAPTDRTVVKLADFGISIQMSAEEDGKVYDFAGRPYDYAPELVTEGFASRQSDIYQLGLMFYNMITGRAALSKQDGPVKVATTSGVARQRAEGLGTPLGMVIGVMLRRRPDYRYKDCKEVWQAVAAAYKSTSNSSGGSTVHRSSEPALRGVRSAASSAPGSHMGSAVSLPATVEETQSRGMRSEDGSHDDEEHSGGDGGDDGSSSSSSSVEFGGQYRGGGAQFGRSGSLDTASLSKLSMTSRESEYHPHTQGPGVRAYRGSAAAGCPDGELLLAGSDDEDVSVGEDILQREAALDRELAHREAVASAAAVPQRGTTGDSLLIPKRTSSSNSSKSPAGGRRKLTERKSGSARKKTKE